LIIDSTGAGPTPRRVKEGAWMPERIPSSSSAPIGVNGGLITLTLRDQNGKLQIFTITSDGTNKKQLTFDGDNGRPDWSPDGKQIVFNSIRNGKLWVAVMDADGSNQKLLTEGVAPDWSPDGKQIAFSRPVPPGSEIWVINADGSGVRQITQSGTAKAGPSWSPDGKQMVFILPKNPISPTDPQPEIGIMDSDGTNERILTIADRINTDGRGMVCETANDANAPAWSPVDNRITFWSGIENQYGQVWVINSDGTGSKQLTEDCSHRNSDDPSWSPDGKKILFSTGRSGRNELWVMDADGENEQKISDIDANPFPGRASWQRVQDSGDTESPAVSDAALSKKKVKRNIDPTVTITWTSSDNTAVASHEIQFAGDGVNFSTTVIAGLAGNERSFTWTVPDSLPKTGAGRIKIIARDAQGNAGEVVSGKLKIK
jgi:TolB protein